MRSRVLAVLGASAAVLALAGCSSEMSGTPSATGGAPAQQSQAPSSSAPETSSSAPSTGTSSTVSFTPQGTKLKLGEKAIVPFKSEGRTGAIGVTVTAIDKGTEADLAPLQLGDRAKGMTPFYVRVTVSNESGTDFSYTSLGLMNGIFPDGDQAQGVSVIGTFDKCDSGDAGKAFTTKGATFQSCDISVAPAGGAVTGASYNEADYKDQAPNTDYGTDPITWQS